MSVENRSIFNAFADSLLSLTGCIPVFLHICAVYEQFILEQPKIIYVPKLHKEIIPGLVIIMDHDTYMRW